VCENKVRHLVITFYLASVILSNYQILPATEFSLIIAKSFTEKNESDSLKMLRKKFSKIAVILFHEFNPFL
jgi:hypothetical protein